jgi:hypothetical protein
MGFESNEYTDGISIFNLNEDDGNWDVYSDPWWNLARTGDFCLAYNYNKHNDANDWAILEPIKIEEEDIKMYCYGVEQIEVLVV